MSGLEDTARQLAGAHSTLSRGWAATTALWSDAVQRDFEKEYLDALESQVWATAHAMDGLGQLVSQAQRHVR